MARGRLAANVPGAGNESVPVASSTFNEFDAEASLLALQKHVDAAAANGVANAHTVAKLQPLPQPPAQEQLSAEEAAANSIAYAASAALVAVQNNNSNNNNNNNYSHGHLGSDPDAIIHPDLRPAYTTTNTITMSGAPQPTAPGAQTATSPQEVPAALPQQPQHTAPAPVAPQQSVSPAGSQELAEVITDGRKGPRRELSTSKRAAQNRAAQRAFRQRKEGYIKKLEQQVQDYGEMETQFKITQTENYALREYIIHLQSRLLDAKAELPQPPANLNLAAPGMPPIMSIGPSPTQQHQQVQLQQRQQLHAQQQQQHQQQYQEQQQAPAPSQEAAHTAAAPSAAQAVAAAAAAAAAAADEQSSAAGNAASDAKTDASLARVAQAVAQLGNSTAETSSAGAAPDSASNGIAKTEPETNGNSAGEPMDTTEETITQKLQKLSEPVASM